VPVVSRRSAGVASDCSQDAYHGGSDSDCERDSSGSGCECDGSGSGCECDSNSSDSQCVSRVSQLVVLLNIIMFSTVLLKHIWRRNSYELEAEKPKIKLLC
jgi:hypothetical protein